uniref:Uncharacterized protein n=1 Tax=Setaria viridis TaxID=4556 RepID=A0A4V6D710_SETVI|nr:hypothetical protein SEVIR_5G302850v2 [Setaria viridis]
MGRNKPHQFRPQVSRSVPFRPTPYHHQFTTTTMTATASFVGVGGRGLQVLAIAWCSRRHMLPRPEFLPLGFVGRALEHAREAGAAITTTGLRADLACVAGPRLPT